MRRVADFLSPIALAAAVGVCSTASAQPVSHDFNNDGTNDYPVSITGYEASDPVTGAVRMWSGASKSIIDTIVSPDTNT